MVCGYGLEFNIVSDLDLHMSTNQINLALQKITEITKTLTSSSKSEKSDDLDEKDVLKDSGLGSEASVKPTPSEKVKGQGQNTMTLTPVDLLLTAGRISVTLYSHEMMKTETVIGKSKETCQKKKNKRSKQDLEWRVEPGSSDGLDAEEGQVFSEHQEPYLMQMYGLESSRDSYTISAGTMCIKPFLFVYVSQPHTVLSVQKQQQKFEASCYDVLVKGAAETALIPGKYSLNIGFESVLCLVLPV